MKTTNFEISKKLKEIGFNAETDKCWAKIRNSKLDEFSIRTLDFSIPENCDEWYPSYDLETLINALPVIIEKNKKNYILFFSKDTIGYYPTLLELDYANIQLHDYIFELYIHHESLADTAGKLLIELFDAGIINFNK